VRLVCGRSGTGSSRGLFLAAVAGLLVVALVLRRFDMSVFNHLLSGQTALAPFAVRNHSPSKARTGRLDYGRLPLAFEPNQGQSDPDVKFLAHGPGYGIFLTSDGAVLWFRSANPHSSGEKISAVRMQFVGARGTLELSGTDRLPGTSNYFIGNDPAKWHRDLPQFARVQDHDLYPGIDLIFHGNQGRLEYDFEIAPGGDPGAIQLGFQNAGKLAVDSRGDLVLSDRAGAIRFEAPRAYQQIGTKGTLINARFVLRDDGKVGFQLGSYDRSRVLIIDPVLSYLTFVGGTGDEACPASARILVGTISSPPPGCPALAVDSAGNTYVAGSTASADFPTTPNPTTDTLPLQSTLASPPDVFVTKINAAGNAIVFSTYLGGHGIDSSAGLALNSGLDPVVAGSTTSTDFPISPGTAFQSTALNPSAQHAFVTELDPNGHALVYSTYLSGTGTEAASGVAVDFRNKIYVLGTTTSKDQPSASSSFPATLGAFQTVNGATSQFFLSKIDPTLAGFSSLAYSTYFGGSTPTNALTLGGGIAVDASANVYITGGTNFEHTGTSSATAPDFPILNAYQGCLNTPPTSTTPTNCSNTSANTDAFIAKINPTPASGSQLLYSSYLGGTGDDVGYGVAVDSGLQAYVTGSTTSNDFVKPAGTVPFQPANGGGVDAFVAKFGNPCTGSACTTTTLPLNYFSYLGGANTDVGLGIVTDSSQGAHVTGWTNSGDFPLNKPVNTPIQGSLAGGIDAFVSRVDTTATSATAMGHSGTYLGGAANDFGTSIANDAQGNTYAAGETASGSFSTPTPVQHLGPGGGIDAFVSKLGPIAKLKVTETVSPTPVGVGNQVTFTYTILNNGDFINGIVFTDAVPANATFVSASSSPGQSSCGATNGVVSCSVGSLNGGASATVRVIFTPSAASPLSDGGIVSVLGTNAQFTAAPAVAAVNDFAVSVSPNTITAAAGIPATYTVTVTPTGSFPESVSLSASGAPSGASPAASFPNGSSITSLTSGPQSRLLVINTAARVTTPASLLHNRHLFYVTWMPVSGFVLLGLGISLERSRRYLKAWLLTVFIGLIVLQAGCGSSRSKSTTTGTPAGTYPITVTATSGSVSRTQQVILIVQ
jgi:uncharacterized repeat protein (TIGR01451 family)